MQSSSSQHQRSKSTGCMSGILHLITRHHHHSRSRKRLSSAPKKRDKSAVSPEKRAPPPKETSTTPASTPRQRSSCDAPRSPTLPPELRRPGPPSSPDSPRRPSALVARLMGLDETPVDSPRSTADKRRKLLGALEKCDDDLRALKRIIEAVQTAEVHKRAAAAAAAGAVVVSLPTVVKEMDGRDSTIEVDQPSPVSVLDALSSPRHQRPHKLENGVHTRQPILAVRSRLMERRATGVFYSGEGQKMARRGDENRSFFRIRVSMDELPRAMEQREGESLIDSGLARWRMGGGGWRWRRQRSRAMLESVKEVWEDGVWEEKWEFGRVGVVLESEILGDLVEEVVTEMLGCCYKLSLPLGTCKKRLYF